MQKLLGIKKFFNSKKRIAVLVIVIILVVFGIWKMTGNDSAKVQYQTALVERGTLVSSVAASGQMLSSNYFNLNTKASGIIKTVYVKDGDKVYAGQKVAELELDREGQQANSQAYTSYLSAKNSLDSANVSLYSLDSGMWAAYNKYVTDALSRGLPNTDPTFIQESDDWLAAEAKYKNQQKVIAQNKSSVSNAWITYQQTSSIITSSNSGIVSNITIVPGMMLGQSTSATRVAIIKTQGKPLVTLNLSEIDIPKIKQGQKAIITIDSLTGKTYSGKVVSIDRIGTVSSGVTNYPVIVQFDTESEDLLPNMSVSANIINETRTDVLMVPSTAVKSDSNGNYVQVLKNVNPVSVSVEIGISNDTQTEIVLGLNEGESVVSGTISSTATTGSSSRTTSPFGSIGGNVRFSGGGTGR